MLIIIPLAAAMLMFGLGLLHVMLACERVGNIAVAVGLVLTYIAVAGGACIALLVMTIKLLYPS